MNEHRETMNGVSTTSSAIVGHCGETQKRPYMPPRVEALSGTNRDTAAKASPGDIETFDVCTVGPS